MPVTNKHHPVSEGDRRPCRFPETENRKYHQNKQRIKLGACHIFWYMYVYLFHK